MPIEAALVIAIERQLMSHEDFGPGGTKLIWASSNKVEAFLSPTKPHQRRAV
jgi:hypothetical protein